MIRLGFIADVHLANHRQFGGPVVCGVNRRCGLALEALRGAFDRAQRDGVDRMYILGDLFDDVSPLPQITYAVQETIRAAGIPTVILVGNHDQVSASVGDHALGPLSTVAWIADLFDDPPVISDDGVQVICVSYRPGRVSEWLPKLLERAANSMGTDSNRRVLAMHQGIITSDTKGFLRKAPDAIEAEELAAICDRFDIGSVFTGHWHYLMNDMVGGVHMVQVGALVPTGFNNPGMDGYGGLMEFNVGAEGPTRVEIPGPRFLVDETLSEPDIRQYHPLGLSTFWRYTAIPPDDTLELLRDLKERGLIGGYSIDPSDKLVKEAAQAAASAARSATTLSDAVAEYISKMPLPDGVDRQRVETKVRDYLGL